MNSINENEIRLANLNAELGMRRAYLGAARKPLNESFKRVFAEVIAASGVDGYALSLDEEGNVYDFNAPVLSGEIDGKRLYDIHCYFRNGCWCDVSNEPCCLSFNTTSFGDVKVGDAAGVAYCAMVGYLARNLQSIQDALNALPGWEAYRTAKQFYYAASNKVEEQKRKMEEEAKAAKEASVLKRLVSGAEVANLYKSHYDFERHIDVITGVTTKKVEKVTNKLVFFENDYRQHKKADVVAKILRGLDKGGWSFAEDIDMSQFPSPCDN